MRIEYDIKLGFKNVMIRPKRSTLKSRSQVNLSRGFNFLHSKYKWEGVPIMAANMDTVGTFEMAKALYKHNIFTTIHKHYSVDEWTSFLKNEPEAVVNYLAVSTGTSEQDANKLAELGCFAVVWGCYWGAGWCTGWLENEGRAAACPFGLNGFAGLCKNGHWFGGRAHRNV